MSQKRICFTNVLPKQCSWHKPHKLGYLASFTDAERRIKLHQHQVQCHICGFWIWPEHFGVDPLGRERPALESRVRLSQRGRQNIRMPRKHWHRIGTVIRLSQHGNVAHVRWDGNNSDAPLGIALIEPVKPTPEKT